MHSQSNCIKNFTQLRIISVRFTDNVQHNLSRFVQQYLLHTEDLEIAYCDRRISSKKKRIRNFVGQRSKGAKSYNWRTQDSHKLTKGLKYLFLKSQKQATGYFIFEPLSLPFPLLLSILYVNNYFSEKLLFIFILFQGQAITADRTLRLGQTLQAIALRLLRDRSVSRVLNKRYRSQGELSKTRSRKLLWTIDDTN